MKNLVKSALVALTVGVFAIPASAEGFVINPVQMQDTVVKNDTIIKKDTPEKPMFFAQSEVTYTKIEVAELPECVTKGVAAKYEGYVVEEASKGSDESYKLVIKKDDAKLTVYFNTAGEFVKEEAAQAEGTVLA